MKPWKLFIVCCAAVFVFAAPAAGAADDGIVVVKQGQNLGAIAAQYKVSVAQICQWNNLSSPDKVRVGQRLYVRPPDRAGAAATSAPRAAQSAKQAKSVTQTPQAAVPADGIPEKVKLELANVGKTLVNNAARTIMPNAKAKAVAPGDSGGYVASYVVVDTSDIRTEVIPSAESGKYVGSIRYVENLYECPGKSKAEALQAECRVVRSRRINELVRYEKGKWHH
jgi:LysM repeat protein